MSASIAVGTTSIRPVAIAKPSRVSVLSLDRRRKPQSRGIAYTRRSIAPASLPSSSISSSSSTSTSSPPPTQQQQHPLDAEADKLRYALSNRSTAVPDPQLLEKSRDLTLALAAARRKGSQSAASFLDALAGAVARSLKFSPSSSSPSSSSSSSPPSISSLESNTRLVKAYAQLGHSTLATSELARAAVVQARRALVVGAAAVSTSSTRNALSPIPPPAVPAFAAAASIARSVSSLRIHPGERLMGALSSSAVAFAKSSGGGTTSTTSTDSDNGDDDSSFLFRLRLPSKVPASAVVDWLCACAASGSSLPDSVVDLAASVRFNPIQAATAAAALASIVFDVDADAEGEEEEYKDDHRFSTLVSTLRSRVAGSPRGGVPPRAAVAAAWALSRWRELNAASAVALAEHAEAGVVSIDDGELPNPSLLSKEDLECLWGALRASGWSAVAIDSTEKADGNDDSDDDDDDDDDVAFIIKDSTVAVTPRAQRAARAARKAEKSV